MIRISQIRLRPGHGSGELRKKAAAALRIPADRIQELKIRKRSVDARKKPEIWLLYTVEVSLEEKLEDRVLAQYAAKPAAGRAAGAAKGTAPSGRQREHRRNGVQVSRAQEPVYRFPAAGQEPLSSRPVVVGTGPAGLFAGYLLAENGYRPLLLERGRDADARKADVERFWKDGVLDPASNVQFGEGGAGTFSDGKLNTLVKDPDGRNREVLRIFVENGAPERILYEAKPHIGTDILIEVVKNMRRRVESWGGKVLFQHEAADFRIRDGRLTGLKVVSAEGESWRDTQAVILATGHSARDTFETLYARQVPMESKAFAVGLRVEHPQAFVNLTQYGTERPAFLTAAAYKVTAKASDGRGVYSFCMCPGGYVVNASSEPGRLAVNGMSYSGRDGANANSAVIVTVTPQDFGATGPLAGVAFQRKLEERAFRAADGKIPVQYFGEFAGRSGRREHIRETFLPAIQGGWRFADVRSILPEPLAAAFQEGMEAFDRILPGFADDFVLVSGVESRTSSPVRIPRDERHESAVRGLFPCGEGAGYAGGITSAAMDGMRTAEEIAGRFARPVNDC